MQRALGCALMLALMMTAANAQLRVSGRAKLTDGHGKVLDSANVVASLRPLDAKNVKPAPAKNYRLEQKDKHFSPHLLVVPVGASVEFPNRDPFFHNVFSLFDGTRFDLGLYESGTTKLVKFTRPGPAYIFCNIHPQMSAVVYAVDTPYFAVSNTHGDFEIDGVPPGQYEFKLWSERATAGTLDALTRRITVGSDDLRLDAISIAEAPSLAEGHKNKYGKDYDPAPSYKVP